MKILAIETSCDETAVSIVAFDARGGMTRMRILGDALYSQGEIHEPYGGVFPALAKREHAKNLPMLLERALREGKLWQEEYTNILAYREQFESLFSHEGGLADATLALLSRIKKPEIDAIAVTSGPGLEPALWVGINFAKALSTAWGLPLIPVNHLEGHIVASRLIPHHKGQENYSGILQNTRISFELVPASFPALALIVSGGHTELVLMNGPRSYGRIGETQDDAAGEAFDKVARMLNLPYPGGPHVSRLAKEAREKGISAPARLPRPMIASKDLNFSFAGLKTAVLYAIKELGELTEEQKKGLAREFEDAVVEVLVKKTARALEQTGAKALIVGGGVSANAKLRADLAELVRERFPGLRLFIPTPELTTDNAVMIAAAAYERLSAGSLTAGDFAAQGVMPLSK